MALGLAAVLKPLFFGDAPALPRGDRERLRAARCHLLDAECLLRDVVLSLNTRYATQEPAWQEGKPGMENVRQAEMLRETIERLTVERLRKLEGLDGV